MDQVRMQPRLLRRADAAKYLGISVQQFDLHMRKFLVGIPTGARAITFDRLELDRLVEFLKFTYGESGTLTRSVDEWESKSGQAAPIGEIEAATTKLVSSLDWVAR